MNTVANVVQVGEQNEVLACAGYPPMDSTAAEVSTIVPAGSGAGDLAAAVVGEAVSRCTADVQSNVFRDVTQESAAPCHTSPHKQGGMAAEIEHLGDFQTEGGEGVAARGRASARIGFSCAGNFANGVAASAATGKKQKKGRVVEVVRAHGRKALFGREKKSGALVLVALGRGLHAERFPVPCWIEAEQVDGRWMYEGAIPAPRCPQCLIASPVDCLEQPCGWPKKERGAA